jgi:hypothetical protein
MAGFIASSFVPMKMYNLALWASETVVTVPSLFRVSMLMLARCGVGPMTRTSKPVLSSRARKVSTVPL